MQPEFPVSKQSEKEIYLFEISASISRLLSHLDTNPASITYGNFDREYWAWKFRDFPLAMLQTSVYAMALLWKTPYTGNPFYMNKQILRWIIASVKHTITRQHKNGSFDLVSPNEQDVGSTLGVMHGLTEAYRIIQREMSEEETDLFIKAVHMAYQFAMSRDEKHAFINNHYSLFATSFLNAYEITGNEEYKMKSEQLINRIIEEQSNDGWFKEYNGPDPGYESLGIFHLAMFWKRTQSDRLLKALERSINFYSYCIHPDGSVGGIYGSRHTSLYYPGGFEILSNHLPLAHRIAGLMRQNLVHQNVVTPTTSDFENLPSLLYCYLEAYRAQDSNDILNDSTLPCETFIGEKYFSDAQILFVGFQQYYAVVNASKGGVCRIFDKSIEKVSYEDAGYLIHSSKHLWTSQMQGQGVFLKSDKDMTVHCKTSFVKIRQEMLTPLKLILLRILNLTLFRSLAIGGWIRNRIISRLVLHVQTGPFQLSRQFEFQKQKVMIRDQITALKSLHVKQILLVRLFTAIHMGSANYFHPSQLVEIPQFDLSDLTEIFNKEGQAEHEFVIEFPLPADS